MVAYDPLWETLKAKNMNKTDLQKLTRLSSATIAKLAKNEPVMIDIINRICTKLEVPINDVVEILPD